MLVSRSYLKYRDGERREGRGAERLEGNHRAAYSVRAKIGGQLKTASSVGRICGADTARSGKVRQPRFQDTTADRLDLKQKGVLQSHI